MVHRAILEEYPHRPHGGRRRHWTLDTAIRKAGLSRDKYAQAAMVEMVYIFGSVEQEGIGILNHIQHVSTALWHNWRAGSW